MQKRVAYVGQIQQRNRGQWKCTYPEKESARHLKEGEDLGCKYWLCQMPGPSLASWPPSVWYRYFVFSRTRAGWLCKDTWSLSHPGRDTPGSQPPSRTTEQPRTGAVRTTLGSCPHHTHSAHPGSHSIVPWHNSCPL